MAICIRLKNKSLKEMQEIKNNCRLALAENDVIDICKVEDDYVLVIGNGKCDLEAFTEEEP